LIAAVNGGDLWTAALPTPPPTPGGNTGGGGTQSNADVQSPDTGAGLFRFNRTFLVIGLACTGALIATGGQLVRKNRAKL
jgi:hypothetical protein